MAKSKVIDGVTYWCDHRYRLKSDAQQYARNTRKEGYLARIIKFGGMWEVWVAHKRRR